VRSTRDTDLCETSDVSEENKRKALPKCTIALKPFKNMNKISFFYGDLFANVCIVNGHILASSKI